MNLLADPKPFYEAVITGTLRILEAQVFSGSGSPYRTDADLLGNVLTRL